MNPARFSQLLASLAIAASAALLTTCTFTSVLRLSNETAHTLIPYPVVTTPPPPHRQADPAHPVVVNATAVIDTEGFNPVFYAAGITDTRRPNGLFVGMGFQDEDPPLIEYKLLHYKVEPGKEGTDPAAQPIVIHQEIVEVTDQDTVIHVAEIPGDVPELKTWQVKIEPAAGGN